MLPTRIKAMKLLEEGYRRNPDTLKDYTLLHFFIQ